MAKAEMTVHIADLPEVKAYVRKLEETVLFLWDDLREVERMTIRGDVGDFCRALKSRAEEEPPSADREAQGD